MPRPWCSVLLLMLLALPTLLWAQTPPPPAPAADQPLVVPGTPAHPQLLERMRRGGKLLPRALHGTSRPAPVPEPPGQPGPVPAAPVVTPFAVPPFPCSPANYTHQSDNASMTYDYCPWQYLPWRVWIPPSPANIDSANTTRLRNLYLPNGAFGGIATPDSYTLQTMGYKPTVTDQGFSGAGMYTAKATDPLVTVNCAGLPYGCSDTNGNAMSGSFQIRLPSYTRGSCALCSFAADDGLGALQPDGREFGVYQCHITRDVVNGDTLGVGGSLCDLEGAYIGNVTNTAGVNDGNTSGGNAQSALGTSVEEVNHNQINHSIGTVVGCITGAVWPAESPSLGCSGFTGIPSGSLLWLALTRTQIDNNTAIPANQKVFAYALHEHGAYVLDTSGIANSSVSTISQFFLENTLGPLYSGALARSPWYTWFSNAGGSVAPGGDAQYKLQNSNIFPWNDNSIINNMYVLSGCYALGTCSDSIPDPGTTTTSNPQVHITAPVDVPDGQRVTAPGTSVSPLTTLAGTATSNGGTGLSVAISCTPACTGATVSGTPASWTVPSVTLTSGLNTIVMTATDSNGSSTATMDITYTPTTLPPSTVPLALQSWWLALPGLVGGDRFFDLMPGKQDAQLTVPGYGGAAGWAVSDRRGGVYHVALDGVTSCALTPSATQAVFDFPNQQFSLALWMKTTSVANRYLVAKRTTAGGWFLRVNSDGTLEARITDASNTASAYRDTLQAYNTGVWTHVAVVYTTDTTTGTNNDVTLYVNGVVDQSARGSSFNAPYVTCACALAFGCTSDQAGFVTGGLDDVRIWTRGLSQSEVTLLYRQGLQPPSGAPGIVAQLGITLRTLLPFFRGQH